MNTIRRLRELGQSVWLDFLDYELVVSGELRQMVDRYGISGVTSNPTIFQKAISKSADYDDLIHGAPFSESDASVFERIEVRDASLGCDELRPVYGDSAGTDGFVSVEVSPRLAGDTIGSIEEARRLWSRIERPNLMVKIPGTREGLPAIERCLAEGINVNITLLFSVERYVEVAEAYLRALEARLSQGKPIDRIASVASFFVSRVDAKVDKALGDRGIVKGEGGPSERGRAAIANAKLAFEQFETIFYGQRWQRLGSRGGRPQRVLWASTSPKDPAYPDLYYAEALIGPSTIDTMTKETLRAYLDHGRPEPRLALARDEARDHIRALSTFGIDFARVTQELEDEGVRAFATSFDQALASISNKRGARAG